MVEGRKSLLENIFHACECGVCFTYRPERVILLCGHQICKDCVSSMWTTRKEQAKTQPPEQSKDKDWLNCPYCKANFKWTGSARGQRKSSRIDLNSAKFLGALQHYLDRKDLCQYRKAGGVLTHQLPLDYYCQTCGKDICALCVSEIHSSHDCFKKSIDGEDISAQKEIYKGVHGHERLKFGDEKEVLEVMRRERELDEIDNDSRAKKSKLKHAATSSSVKYTASSSSSKVTNAESQRQLTSSSISDSYCVGGDEAVVEATEEWVQWHHEPSSLNMKLSKGDILAHCYVGRNGRECLGLGVLIGIFGMENDRREFVISCGQCKNEQIYLSLLALRPVHESPDLSWTSGEEIECTTNITVVEMKGILACGLTGTSWHRDKIEGVYRTTCRLSPKSEELLVDIIQLNSLSIESDSDGNKAEECVPSNSHEHAM